MQARSRDGEHASVECRRVETRPMLLLSVSARLPARLPLRKNRYWISPAAFSAAIIVPVKAWSERGCPHFGELGPGRILERSGA